MPQPMVVMGGVPDEIDVVVCPRKREYGKDKNWQHWHSLVDTLMLHGLSVFAAGHPNASYNSLSCKCAWSPDMGDRYLDNSIAAMLRAKIVLATDGGLAHLALMCGKPLLLISHGEGLVADGVDDVGKPYWPIKLERFVKENHCDAPIWVVYDAWHSSLPAAAGILHLLRNMNGVCEFDK